MRHAVSLRVGRPAEEMRETGAHSGEPAPTATKVVRWSVVAALMALTVALRLWPIGASLPYIDYIDEGHVLHQALTVLNSRSYDTGFYGYPGLPSYLTAGAAIASSPLYQAVHGRTLWQDLAPGRHLSTGFASSYDLIYPQEVILIARLVVVAFSVATVALAGAVGRSVGGFATSVSAMLLVAVCPALVTRGSNVIVDTFAAFFTLAALFFCHRLGSRSEGAFRGPAFQALAAGLMAGFAYGSKYTAGAVFVGVLVAIVVSCNSVRQKLCLAALASASLAIAALLSTPALISDPARIVSALHEQAAFYKSNSETNSYWRQTVSFAEAGIPLIVAAVCGVTLMLRSAALRSTTVSWLCFAAVMFAAFLPQNYQPFRNLLPLVPLACIAAAFALTRLLHWSAGRNSHLVAKRSIWITAGLILILPMAISSAAQIYRRASHVQSRVGAVDWLQQHARADNVVLAIEELAIVPSEISRVPARLVIVPWRSAAETLRRGEFDFVLTSEFDIRYAGNPVELSAYLSEWTDQTSRMPIEGAFGNVPNPLVPQYWRTNDERVLVLKAR